VIARGGGVNESLINFFKNLKIKTLQEGDEQTNQQRRHDSLENTNAAKKEWDQLDTWLTKYNQNSE
jgi:hypothetical protein